MSYPAQMYSSMLGKEPVQCEEEGREGEEVPVSRGGEEECHQNGDGGHDAPLEGETKPEEEHNGNRSANSPSEGQQ